MVVCPSTIAEALMKEVGMKNVKTLTLFVDSESFYHSEASDGERKIIYIGRLTKDKGVDKIVRLADRMRDYRNVKFSISGVGPEDYSIGKLVESLDLGAKVKMNGFVNEKQKIRELKEAALFIHPSESDTFGIAVLEALASGRPALVSKNFPLVSYCKKGSCGMIPVDFSEPESVEIEIKRVLENPEIYRELSESGSKFAREQFSPRKHAENLLQLYSSQMAK